jgi:hypothetical protein
MNIKPRPKNRMKERPFFSTKGRNKFARASPSKGARRRAIDRSIGVDTWVKGEQSCTPKRQRRTFNAKKSPHLHTQVRSPSPPPADTFPLYALPPPLSPSPVAGLQPHPETTLTNKICRVRSSFGTLPVFQRWTWGSYLAKCRSKLRSNS